MFGYRNAWAITVVDDVTAEAAIKLAASIWKTNTRHLTYIFCKEDLKERYGSELKKVIRHGALFFANINQSSVKDYIVYKMSAWDRSYFFSKMVLLEPDVMFLKNADELFDYPEFSAVPDANQIGGFDPGVFVAVPDAHNYESTMEFLMLPRSDADFDIGLLNECFDKWHELDESYRLPRIYNMPTNAPEATDKDVKIVRFANKPWIQMERTGAEKKFWDQWNQLSADDDISGPSSNPVSPQNTLQILFKNNVTEDVDLLDSPSVELPPDPYYNDKDEDLLRAYKSWDKGTTIFGDPINHTSREAAMHQADICDANFTNAQNTNTPCPVM